MITRDILGILKEETVTNFYKEGLVKPVDLREVRDNMINEIASELVSLVWAWVEDASKRTFLERAKDFFMSDAVYVWNNIIFSRKSGFPRELFRFNTNDKTFNLVESVEVIGFNDHQDKKVWIEAIKENKDNWCSDLMGYEFHEKLSLAIELYPHLMAVRDIGFVINSYNRDPDEPIYVGKRELDSINFVYKNQNKLRQLIYNN